MPAFAAINVEVEDNVEDEADVTRRIQIDDALKYYQTALKYHAQGPASFADAEAAYKELFASAIFSYPEAATDYERSERTPLDPSVLLLTQGAAAALDPPPPVVLDDNAAGGENSSSLPQAYYIAHKNHGQFLLDKVRHKARVRRAAGGKDARDSVFAEPEVHEATRQALDEFSAALDRDPSDAELWRRTARVAAFLKSARVSRYCLEAAIELDDDPAVVEVEPPSLAEGFAGVQLRQSLARLGDDVALSHPGMAPFVQRDMAAALQRYLDPLPWLPDPTRAVGSEKTMTATATATATATTTTRLTLSFAEPSWAALGFALVASVEEHGMSGQAVCFDAPPMPDEQQIMQIELDQQLSGVPEVEAEAEAEAAGDEPGKTDDVEMEEEKGKDKEKEKDDQAVKETGKERSGSLSRKRSQSTAGMPEPDDDHGDTKRSKRIRRRETQEGASAAGANVAFAEQLRPLQEADVYLLQHVKTLLQKLGVVDGDGNGVPAALDETMAACGEAEGRLGRLQDPLARDMLAVLTTAYKDERAKLLLSKKDTPVLGLEAFLERTKSSGQQQHHAVADGDDDDGGGGGIRVFDETSGLRAFVAAVNNSNSYYTAQDVAYEYLKSAARSYVSQTWSEGMKRAVIQVLDAFDAVVYRRMRDDELPAVAGAVGADAPPQRRRELRSLVQMIIELYVDVFERMMGADGTSSAVDVPVWGQTQFRLDRWVRLATALWRMSAGADADTDASSPADTDLAYRFLWATVWTTTLTPGVARDHMLACWESLRRSLLEEEAATTVVLPNSTVMPEVSHKAADREISKLTTMDFLLSLFQEELKDPVVVIEKLEPVLNPETVCVEVVGEEVDKEGGEKAGEETGEEAGDPRAIAACAGPELRDMWKFLRGSSTELRIFLWTRLADAYKGIAYPTKVLSCYLRSIEMVVDDLAGMASRTARTARTATVQEPARLQTMMLLLKTLDETTTQALHIALNNTKNGDAFEIFDEAHLRTSAAALVRVGCMLHVAALHDDEVRIGMATAASGSTTYAALQAKLREMQVRTWSLLYAVVRAGLRLGGVCASGEGDVPKDRLQHDLADLLGAIHNVVGSRKYCKASNKIFLRLARSELLRMRAVANLEDYLGQVLYDLHGIKLGVGLAEVAEHGCPVEKLERGDALALVDKVMALAGRMAMKDLLKSDLKNTIEQMQQAIGQTKSTTQMIHNLRYFTEYLKRPINPMRLYQAWKGVVALDTVPATTPDAVLARNGWFFLLGMVALTKFKGVDLNRRQTPGATDDLRVGAQYLRLQLQLTPTRWDAWFRLAECSDYDLDETVLWTADKMNKDRADLVKLQRTAIQCYTLALSYFHADPGDAGDDPDHPEDAGAGAGYTPPTATATADAVHDLYYNFALRMYSSSREPFAMECFRHAEHERWLVTPDAMQTYRKPQHVEMSAYMVCKYAAGLFRRALARRPTTDWKSAYMLSKCTWKLFQFGVDKPSLSSLSSSSSSSRPSSSHPPPTVDDVVASLERSIQVVMRLPKPRHGQQPILEPHYKMVTVVDKMVRRGVLGEQAAADILQRQPMSIQRGAAVEVADRAAWDAFVLATLKHLRDKDKSNWQHRMIMRQARILFDDCDLEGAGESADDVSKDVSKDVPKDEADSSKTAVASDVVSDSITVKHAGGSDTADKMAVDGVDGVDGVDVVTEKEAEPTKTPQESEPAVTTTPHDARVEKAKAAFAVLRESMFTKTMVMNVWKCDAERPGRHHVFTEQYIRFMTRLLVVLEDRANLEALLRRIRKKAADFYHFVELWQTCIMSYVRLVRSHYRIPADADDLLKNMAPDAFDIYAERINAWVAHQPDADHRALRAMREAVEIKKLNSALMKAAPIDDLISNCYSVIVAEVARGLPGEDPAAVLEGRRADAEKAEAEKAEAERAEAKAEAEKAEAEKAEKERKSETTASIMLSFNLLSDRGGADKDKDGFSRAGSETPGNGLLSAAEKMERSGSGVGGDAPHKRPRVYTAVRRPDILRKAEQATALLCDMLAKTAGGGGGSNTDGGNGTGSAPGTANNNNGTSQRRAGDGPSAAGPGLSRRSTRLGSSSATGLEAVHGKEGDGSNGEGSGGDGRSDGGGNGGNGSGSGSTHGLTLRTRSKSRHLSVDQSRAKGEEVDGEADDGEVDDGVDAEMHDSAGSPHASIDDDLDLADDDSELSDVPADYEDNAPLSMLFPNLRRSQDVPDKAGESDGDGEADDEEEEEEDADDEDDEDDDDDDDEEETEMVEDDDEGDNTVDMIHVDGPEDEEDGEEEAESEADEEEAEEEEGEEEDVEEEESDDEPAQGDTVTVAIDRSEDEDEDEDDEDEEEGEEDEEEEEGETEEEDEDVDDGTRLDETADVDMEDQSEA